MTPPRVFISHASEDKKRFVIDFATKLRANGVDAWVDEWEMLPGDSLVDRIFEEGIKKANAIIIVLSSNSVHKPWVREELNASLVRRIEGKAKIIPIVLDQCEMPEALKSTIWQPIPDADNYQAEFERILASIFEIERKPPIGAPPKYTQLQVETLPSLTEMDTVVFSKICELAMEKGTEWINSRVLVLALQEDDIPENEVFESITVLNDNVFIEGAAETGGRISFFKLTTYGFETYAQHFLPQYDDVVREVLLSVVNQGASSNEDLARDIEQPKILIDFALDTLANRGLFKVAKAAGGHVHVHSISVRAKRAAKELSD